VLPIAAKYQRTLPIANGAAVELPAQYTVCFAAPGIVGADLIASGHVRADLADLRVFGPSGEIHRVIDTLTPSRTELCFRLERAIAAGTTDDGYSLHYGDPSAAPPPDTSADVFAFFDGFDGAAIDKRWLMNGAPTLAGGILVLPKNGEPGLTTTATSDGVDTTASLEIRAKVDDPSSAPETSSGYYWWLGFQHTGDFTANAPWDVFIGRSKNTVEAEHNTLTGSCTGGCDDNALGQTSDFRIYRVDRSTAVVDFYYDDGTKFEGAGSNGDLSIMLRNFLVTSDVEIDWVRARPLVAPEPTTVLGPETSIP
jgi:hypothetical protein